MLWLTQSSLETLEEDVDRVYIGPLHDVLSLLYYMEVQNSVLETGIGHPIDMHGEVSLDGGLYDAHSSWATPVETFSAFEGIITGTNSL